MPRHQYKTVADELLEFTDIVITDFRNRGFRVGTERSRLGFPYTPTFVCTRGNTTIVVELDAQIRFPRLEDWVRYGSSCGRDTRVALCLPISVTVSGDDFAKLQQARIGLYNVSLSGLVEHFPPVDLGLNISLPVLASLPRNVRRFLGSAYEQFARSQWREGFEDACQVLEAEARRYLKRWSRTGRIQILRRRGPIRLSDRQIDRLTMGQLVKTFSAIQAQNHADSVIGRALDQLNRDRIGVVHHKTRAITEKRLRSNVGQHMWVIIAALKELG